MSENLRVYIISSEAMILSFYSEGLIKISTWNIANKLVEDIDPNDIHYVAFSKHFRCKIWSGDKSLMKGLSKK